MPPGVIGNMSSVSNLRNAKDWHKIARMRKRKGKIYVNKKQIKRSVPHARPVFRSISNLFLTVPWWRRQQGGPCRGHLGSTGTGIDPWARPSSDLRSWYSIWGQWECPSTSWPLLEDKGRLTPGFQPDLSRKPGATLWHRWRPGSASGHSHEYLQRKLQCHPST